MRIFRGIRWRWVRPVAAGGLFCIVALVAAKWTWQLERVDGWLHAQIVALPDDDVEPWLQGFAESREDAALAALVIDLASERDAVRAAAEQVLLREVDRWETLPAKEAASRALTVGEALQRLPRGKAMAEAVVGRLDAWSQTDECGADTRARLGVLLHGLPRHAHFVENVGMPAEPEPRRLAATPRRMEPAPVQASEIVQAVAATPALVAEKANEPPAVSANAAAAIQVEPNSPPELLPPAAREARPLRSPEWDLAPRPEIANEGIKVRPKPAPEPPLDREVARQMTTRELFQLLPGSHRPIAEVELRERGFRDEHLELARHLSSADVEERRAWTEALPRVSGIEARVWLAWMTKDPDAGVRRSAVTLLLTMPDEAAKSVLREIAVRDPDPAVRRLAAERANRP